MNRFDDEELGSLQEAARGLLDRHSDSRSVRSLIEQQPPVFDEALWKEMANLGWCGLLVPEEFGGVDGGMTATTIVLRELGAHFTPGPFLESAVLATSLLANAPSRVPGEQWLPSLAAGGTIAAVAVTGPGGRVHPGSFDLRATGSGAVTIEGTARFVVGASAARLVIVGAIGDDGLPVLAAVPADTEGVSSESVDGIDLTRPLGHLRFSGVTVDAEAVLARGEAARHLLDGLLDVAAVAIAADAIGAAARALETAVEYSKQRVQFGRVIGSFQAIKHKLADMYVLQQASEAAIEGASQALDIDPVGSRRRAAAVGSFCRASAGRIVGDALQTFAGIGFTWEHDCHLLFKRAKFDEVYLTDLWDQQDRLMTAVAHAALPGQ